METWGAFAFGTVLGWFLYFTNRYRKGETQLSDVATLIGVIGGGAVTALFGDAKTTLFGAYGVGLAVGFFAYFVVLVIMVRNSGGVFGIDPLVAPIVMGLLAQIVGLVARRVVTRISAGDEIETGQRIGLMKFGSRMDIFLPPGVELTVEKGARVVAGETVIARWPA